MKNYNNNSYYQSLSDKNYKSMFMKIDSYRKMYRMYGLYNDSLDRDIALADPESVSDEEFEVMDSEKEDETKQESTLKVARENIKARNKARKKELPALIDNAYNLYLGAVSASKPNPVAVRDTWKDYQALVQELQSLRTSDRGHFYHYFGFVLYPCKSELHYRFLEHLPYLFPTHAFAFHYKEFDHSLKAVEKIMRASHRSALIEDILRVKASGEKFKDSKGKEVHLIEPHVHVIFRTDNRMTVEGLTSKLGLEYHLCKWFSPDLSWMKAELNPLNYLVHLGRCPLKFSDKDPLAWINVDEDRQSRYPYDLSDVVACPKWLRKISQDIEAESLSDVDLIRKYTDWLTSLTVPANAKRVTEFWAELNHGLYLNKFLNSAGFRSQINKLTDQFNARFRGDDYFAEDLEATASYWIKWYEEHISDETVRGFNLSSFCPLSMWPRIEPAVSRMMAAKRERCSLADRPTPMRVIYLQGDAGSGKTTLAKVIAKHLGYSFFVSGSSNDPLEGYNEQDCLIVDDFRPSGWKQSDFLKMLDNHTNSAVKARYHNKSLYYCKLLILTSTWPLSRIWSDMIEKSTKKDDIIYLEPIKQLYRRISYVGSPTSEGTYFMVDHYYNGSVVPEDRFILSNPALRYVGDEDSNSLPALESMPGYQLVGKSSVEEAVDLKRLESAFTSEVNSWMDNVDDLYNPFIEAEK